MDYFWIVTIIVFASLLKGLTGFGFALVSLPFLLIWYAPKEIIPVLVTCNLLASTVIILQKKSVKLIDKYNKRLIIYGGVFSILGVVFLKYLPAKILILIMSVFFIVLSILSFWGVRFVKKKTMNAYRWAGAFIGFLTGSISISGPPLAIFLQSTNTDKTTFREVFAWFSIVSAFISLVSYIASGLYSLEQFYLSAVFFPILWLGSFIGKRLNHKMDYKHFNHLILLFSIFSSLFLLYRVF